MKLRAALLASIGACGILTPLAAKAADANAQGSVGEVIVTAGRRAEVLQKVPVAATVLSGKKIQKMGGTSVISLQFLSPSMSIQTGDEETNINIRGIGKGEANIVNQAGVIVYWDGVSGFSTSLQSEPFFDIASVEVYRGPQGTFGGANASGGAIFVKSNDPDFSGEHGNLLVGYGNYNDAQLQGAVNLPVSDTLSLRLAANLERHDSFFNVTGPYTGDPGRLQEASGRFGLHWRPTSALDVLFKTEIHYIDRGGPITSDASNPLREDQANPANPFDDYSDAHNMAIDRLLRSSLNVSYKFSSGITLRSITGFEYGRSQENYDASAGNEGIPNSPYPAEYFHGDGTDQLFSEELNLVSPDTGPLKWIGGLYFKDDLITLPNDGFVIGIGSGTPPNRLANVPATIHNTTEAAFGQVTYDLTSALTLAVGGRYTWSTDHLIDSENIYSGGVVALAIPANESSSDGKLTGKVSLDYKITPDQVLYAFVATGHKAGGPNDSPVFPSTKPPIFQAEDVTDYELGLKSTFFGGHLHTQIGGYYNDYRNFQLDLFLPNFLNTEIENVTGHTIIEGVELQAQAVFGDFSLDGNASYLHSKIGHFIAADQCSISPVVGMDPGCGGQLINVSGNQQDYAPEWTFNIGAQYAFHLNNDSTITPRVDYSYVSPQWGTVFELAADKLRQRNIVNAQLAYARGRYELTAYATNLFNLIYIDSGIEGGMRYPGPPRQFGVRLGVTF
jgi:iron complex outermembrane receptor protein